MHLEFKADQSVFGLDTEVVFFLVERGCPGPVDDIRTVLDSVLNGHDMRFVHRNARFLDARLDVTDMAGKGLAIAADAGPPRRRHGATGGAVRRVRRRRCAALRRRQSGARG